MASPSIVAPDTTLIPNPVVGIVMPHYGTAEVAAVMAVMSAPQHNKVNIAPIWARSSSLLPHTFNGLLCSALDARDHGIANGDGDDVVRLTHMVMLHSDIQPHALNWVDVLFSEMWKSGADLVSVVVPIKCATGETSTAVGKVSDPWYQHKLHFDDIDRLPITFGTEHVNGGDPDKYLMVNTGCFIADLRRPWWNDFAFGFQTRVVKGADGRWSSEIRPEDWEMSRHLHLAGAKVMATSRLPVVHLGGGEWPNNGYVRIAKAKQAKADAEAAARRGVVPASAPVLASA